MAERLQLLNARRGFDDEFEREISRLGDNYFKVVN